MSRMNRRSFLKASAAVSVGAPLVGVSTAASAAATAFPGGIVRGVQVIGSVMRALLW